MSLTSRSRSSPAQAAGLAETVAAADGFFRIVADGFLSAGAEAPLGIAQLSAVEQSDNTGKHEAVT